MKMRWLSGISSPPPSGCISPVSAIMFAGKEVSNYGVIDRKTQAKLAVKVLDRLQPGINPNEMMRNLRVGQQQIVEIAKTMSPWRRPVAPMCWRKRLGTIWAGMCTATADRAS